jgi:PPOX class probable F420-dependent enzyme
MVLLDGVGGEWAQAQRDREGRMERAEIDALLQRRPGLLGHVATTRRDGTPQVVPVWFRWDGSAITIWTTESRGWVRQVARSGFAAFSAGQDRPPFAAVLLRGPAGVATGGDAETSREIRRITERYIDPSEVESYVGAWPALRTIVRLAPTEVSGWGRGY